MLSMFYDDADDDPDGDGDPDGDEVTLATVATISTA
jgi:hypothetical protein